MGCSGSKLAPSVSGDTFKGDGSIDSYSKAGVPQLARLSITGDFNQEETKNMNEKDIKAGEGFVTCASPNVQTGGHEGRCRPFAYAHLTQRGYYPDSPDKANQDALFLVTSALGDDGQHLFGVLDGHGEHGAQCAHHVSTKFPVMLLSDEAFKTDVPRALKNACIYTNENLRKSKIDDSLSGTTACIALMRGEELHVANVGDSRAVLALKRETVGESNNLSKYVAEDLSIDQTPFREDERRRVEKFGARILTLEQLQGLKDMTTQCWTIESECDGDPPRLWAKDGTYPGTAFTRSIGDSVAEEIGVFAEPEVTSIKFAHDHAFIIIASDGVWEFVPSQEAVDIVGICLENGRSPIEAAKTLADVSFKAWMKKENRTDDISIIIISFENPLHLERRSRTRR